MQKTVSFWYFLLLNENGDDGSFICVGFLLRGVLRDRERERERVVYLFPWKAEGSWRWNVSCGQWRHVGIGCPRGIQAGVLVNSKSNPCHCPNTQQPFWEFGIWNIAGKKSWTFFRRIFSLFFPQQTWCFSLASWFVLSSKYNYDKLFLQFF